MKSIKVNLKKKLDESYEIFIGKNAVNRLPEFLKEHNPPEKFAIISDSKVAKIYGHALKRYLNNNGIKAELLTFPHGEKSKNLSTLEFLSEGMIKKGFNRKSAIVAFGGGVTGDIAGFLASIFMRGIPYIQIPTTLLAMVDSSVGGKTGVDLNSGKNLLGSFYQPQAVFIDPTYLKSLPKKQIQNGLAEVIKYGVIKSKSLFNFIEQNMEKIISLDATCLEKIIEESVKIKKNIVEKDEKEANLRMILNYGHSYGHILEKKSEYKLLHGFAISIGMVIANKIAVEKGILKKSEAERIKKLFISGGLPIATMEKIDEKDLKSDKKNSSDYLTLILPSRIGEAIIHKEKWQ